MLKALKIKNIALIEELVIEFDKGLNVLTGETGAGKSIIIDSLAFVLGARSDKTLIRKGETHAKVEAIFDNQNFPAEIQQLLTDLDIDYTGEIMLMRTLSQDGRSDAKINGSPVTISILKKITACLVDIYGQQEQVGLMQTKNQLALLDAFGEKVIKPVLSEYKTLFMQLKEIDKKLDSFGGDEQNYAREKDYLVYVIKELEQANLSANEEQTLIEEKVKLANSEKVMSSVIELENALNMSLPRLSQGLSALSGVTQFDSNLLALKQRLESVKLELDDISETASSYAKDEQFSQRDLDSIEARLEQYKSLKRKYGATVEEVLNYLQTSKQKLYELENREELRYNLITKKNQLLKDIFEKASELLRCRISVAKQLEAKIKATLQDLGMPNCQVQFNFTNTELFEKNLTTNGIGQVEILFNANLGGELNPLNKVASGGELSRFMLAVKSIVAQSDMAQTMVFDEIDTGISGKMAQAMSEKMAEISRNNQVLSITHSVQITSMADVHFLISKKEENSKTISLVRKLTEDERISEIARFMSADSITQSSINAGKELYLSQQAYKQKFN